MLNNFKRKHLSFLPYKSILQWSSSNINITHAWKSYEIKNIYTSFINIKNIFRVFSDLIVYNFILQKFKFLIFSLHGLCYGIVFIVKCLLFQLIL